ncbi:hypothetical protein P3W85_44965, partial [Cupriavidus basilensis]
MAGSGKKSIKTNDNNYHLNSQEMLEGIEDGGSLRRCLKRRTPAAAGRGLSTFKVKSRFASPSGRRS